MPSKRTFTTGGYLHLGEAAQGLPEKARGATVKFRRVVGGNVSWEE